MDILEMKDNNGWSVSREMAKNKCEFSENKKIY